VSPIQAAIERAAVIVVPSMGEGFGMVALEAMERARPVIAAAIGGLGELVQDGRTGFLVPPGEAEPLRGAIVALCSDLARAAAMGEEGRRRALARFLQDFCTDRTELLYEAALASERAPAAGTD
jgi:glycosyltransferase involved in cell wall biosynthesis